MSFRIRLLIAFLLAALLPVLVLAWIVRSEMTDRFTAQYERRIDAVAAAVQADLVVQGAVVSEGLQRLKEAVLADNRLRGGLLAPASDRSFVLDYAGEAMQVAGLDVLQLQDESGRILSSGHFRNEYDRLEPELAAWLDSNQGSLLSEARSPEGAFPALVRIAHLEIAGRAYTLVGGRRVDMAMLASLQRGADVFLQLNYPGRTVTAIPDSAHREGPAMVRTVSVPMLKDGEPVQASFRVFYPLTELSALQDNLDTWFRLVGLATGLIAAAGALWLSARISQPLGDLAEKTALVDLDRLDVDFRSRRTDEIGALSRLLDAMTIRLRKSVASIRDAERRAAVGEMARQVNHDIKNGLTPLRNVLRHLMQLASKNPEELPGVLRERQATLESSLDYLQHLAASYAKLTPKSNRTPCAVNELLGDVANSFRGLHRGRIVTRLDGAPVVMADPVALRRVVENLVDNAIDSLPDPNRTVTLATEVSGHRVLLSVADQGAGMTPEQIDAAFTDFYTTKAHGTGLGLSIVRRLVMDLDGSLRVESEPGRGSRFIVELPLESGVRSP